MAEGRSSAVAGNERDLGEFLYQKLVAEGRIAERLIAERERLIEERRRRRRSGPDGWKDAADDEAFFRRVPAEAFFRRVAADRGEDEE